MPNQTLSEEIQLLAELLCRLRKKDRKYRVFGSDHHHYKLNPVLTEAELREFEEQYEVSLPEDYRLFLSIVGNGGAGPFYGLERLEYSVDGNPSRIFPLTKATEHYSKNELEVFGELTEPPGVLGICHQGCGMYSYLVVCGEAFGTIWDGIDGEFCPTYLTFGIWYKRWAEKALRTLENESLVKKLKTGMTKEEVRKAAKGDWKERPALSRPVIYFEASEIPAQLVLNENGIVIEINDQRSITARP